MGMLVSGNFGKAIRVGIIDQKCASPTFTIVATSLAANDSHIAMLRKSSRENVPAIASRWELEGFVKK